VRASASSTEPFLPETAVHLAGRITNNCFPRYPIDILVEPSTPIKIDGEILNPVVDLLTNCLQNASEHSGFSERAPLVRVRFVRDDSGDLRFEVTNELTSEALARDRLSEISSLIAEEEHANPTAVAEEGRTGIRKMKRILRYDLLTLCPLLVGLASGPEICVSFDIPCRYVHEDPDC
jgi:hypothetical protein